MKFSIILAICLILTATCSIIFANAMADTYPDGILVFAPDEGSPAKPSNAFFIGLALGAFFCTLIFAAMTANAWLVNRMNKTSLQQFTAPLLTACIVSGALTITGIALAA